MKRKKIIPLVSLIVLMVLAMTSATIYYLNTGETKKLNNVVEKEITEENISKNTDEITNDISTDVSKNKDNSNKKEVVKEKEIEKESKEANDSTANSKSSTNNTTTTKKEETSISNNLSNKQDNQSSSNNNSNKVEEPKNNSTIIEIPDEDNKDNVSSFENDEEYIKLKATLEFETRAECQAAADIIGPEYALQGNLRNTSCKSFAYKGTVIGYRLQIWFTDGTWIYNN